MADWLETGVFYPPHLEVGNFVTLGWLDGLPGKQGRRHVRCLVCGITNNTRGRRGDARFIRTHRRCAVYPKQEKS